jgi:hypothetical protein
MDAPSRAGLLAKRSVRASFVIFPCLGDARNVHRFVEGIRNSLAVEMGAYCPGMLTRPGGPAIGQDDWWCHIYYANLLVQDEAIRALRKVVEQTSERRVLQGARQGPRGAG